MAKVTDTVAALAIPVVEAAGCSLWDVEYVKEGADWVLRITIDTDREGGIGIDDCEKMHYAIDPLLDEADPIEGAYNLEVSSPGFDRMFFEAAQLKPYIGRDIDVSLLDPHPEIAGRRKFKGPLKAVEGDRFTVEVLLSVSEGEKPAPTDVSISWDMVKKARLIHIFPDTSKPGAGKNTKKVSGKGGGK